MLYGARRFYHSGQVRAAGFFLYLLSLFYFIYVLLHFCLKKNGRQSGAPCRPNDCCTAQLSIFATSAAWGPLGPWTISNWTRSPSCKVR
jgi:hypothetical protein